MTPYCFFLVDVVEAAVVAAAVAAVVVSRVVAVVVSLVVAVDVVVALVVDLALLFLLKLFCFLLLPIYVDYIIIMSLHPNMCVIRRAPKKLIRYKEQKSRQLYNKLQIVEVG